MPDEITLDLRPNAFDVTEPEIDMYLDIAKESDETIKTFKALATDSHLTGEMFSEYYTKELIKYVLDKRLLDPDTPIKEQDLLALHGFLYAMEFTEAGRLRKVDVVVFGSHGKQPPSYEMVPVLFKKFCVWLNSSSSKALSPEDLAFRAADRLVKLHPFVDANGRSARLLANLILLRHKCVPMAAHALKGKSITITLMRKAQSEYKRTKEEQEKWAMRR
ncbi:MAG: Fic family protein, partial [Candidatus Omnitrophota bacterium]